eukprot:3672677-Pyramimonas_sp.AAC.2
MPPSDETRQATQGIVDLARLVVRLTPPVAAALARWPIVWRQCRRGGMTWRAADRSSGDGRQSSTRSLAPTPRVRIAPRAGRGRAMRGPRGEGAMTPRATSGRPCGPPVGAGCRFINPEPWRGGPYGYSPAAPGARTHEPPLGQPTLPLCAAGPSFEIRAPLAPDPIGKTT